MHTVIPEYLITNWLKHLLYRCALVVSKGRSNESNFTNDTVSYSELRHGVSSM